MTSAKTADIVIAGAGIGGLTTALALHANGIDATVLEAAPEIRPLGVGINIQPAAIAVLTATLGLGDELAATAIPTREHLYVDHTGAKLWHEPRGLAAGHPYPQYSIHRGELQMLLLAAVRDRLGADAVRTGARLQSFEHTGSGIRAHTHDEATGTTVTFEADALIGADGLNSVVRGQLHPGRTPLSAGGMRMWRGLVELDGFLDGRTMIVASDDDATRMVAYPMSARHAARGKALLNWVCLVPGSFADASGDVSLNHPGHAEDVLPHLAHWNFDWLDIRDMLARSSQILRYPMVDRDPLARWGDRQVTLLGDAAHPMYPIGANGASQAILDAAALATELAGHGDVATALDRYEGVRRPATTKIVQANRKMDRAERAMATRPDQDKAATIAAVTSSYRAAVELPARG
ncbi:flavin-dependent oxidoreductase [Streptomyces sp. NBC_01460]|uniref:flavin-dependent oxidoreductase n=1 Tax=Streptomyces sp. NBC_01460 TaxID=2903875 RepID=UPI002E325F82|nr:flavin-dependent oxidoreductase [Streptomyces sp. NBC_01460]